MKFRAETIILYDEGNRTGPYILALEGQYAGDDGVWHSDPDADPVILQRGYPSLSSVIHALAECLTFAPPDFAPLEEGLAQVSGLVDRMTEVETAITIVGDRMNAAEMAIEAMAAPEPAPRTGLLAPRPGKVAAGVRASQTPPTPTPAPGPIRQPSKVISVGHTSHGGLAITAGVGRPGNLAPTGVSGSDSTKE